MVNIVKLHTMDVEDDCLPGTSVMRLSQLDEAALKEVTSDLISKTYVHCWY